MTQLFGESHPGRLLYHIRIASIRDGRLKAFFNCSTQRFRRKHRFDNE